MGWDALRWRAGSPTVSPAARGREQMKLIPQRRARMPAVSGFITGSRIARIPLRSTGSCARYFPMHGGAARLRPSATHSSTSTVNTAFRTTGQREVATAGDRRGDRLGACPRARGRRCCGGCGQSRRPRLGAGKRLGTRGDLPLDRRRAGRASRGACPAADPRAGKPLQESFDDVDEAATLFHLHAEDAVRLTGETISSTNSNKRMWTFYRPVGTWAIITPWNFPLLMFAEFVAPGLATGNSHVVEPHAHASFTVLRAMEILRAAGVPDGLRGRLPARRGTDGSGPGGAPSITPSASSARPPPARRSSLLRG